MNLWQDEDLKKVCLWACTLDSASSPYLALWGFRDQCEKMQVFKMYDLAFGVEHTTSWWRGMNVRSVNEDVVFQNVCLQTYTGEEPSSEWEDEGEQKVWLHTPSGGARIAILWIFDSILQNDGDHIKMVWKNWFGYNGTSERKMCILNKLRKQQWRLGKEMI